MQLIEALQKQLRKIAAETNGQQENVRTFMGRQLLFLHQSSTISLLPHSESDDIQITDPLDPNYGQFYSMVDMDAVDSGIVQ